VRTPVRDRDRCRDGEVLAMVNQPSYNPNDREQLKAGLYRNRAATDIFEPGSSIKPFIMAAALASDSTSPTAWWTPRRILQGRQQGGGGRTQSRRDRFGDDPGESSNVGMAKSPLASARTKSGAP